jgi:hypothetical protein
MNAVNRVWAVLMLLVAIPLCTILLVFPMPVLEAIGAQSTALLDFVSRLQWYVRVSLGILFALALDVIFILLIVLELRRSTPKAIRVKQTAGGEVKVGVGSIADRLKYEIDQLSSVLRTKPKVLAKRGGVVLELDVETAAEIDVPAKAAQIVETARQVVEEKMGLKLARPPKVNLRAVPYPSTPRRPSAPGAPKIDAPGEPDLPSDTALDIAPGD